MLLRLKSPDRVLQELRRLSAESPGDPIALTDNIMPRSYFCTLLPRLPDELPGARPV